MGSDLELGNVFFLSLSLPLSFLFKSGLGGVWRPEKDLLKSVLFFYHMSSRDRTQGYQA